MTDRFTLLSELGSGGMGAVWKARDTETGETVALKLVHAHLAKDPDYVARFEREVEVAQRIDSPNVVKVLGYGTRDGIPFMAMEYVEGQSLREVLTERGKLPWDEAKPIVRQVAEGLGAAHAAGVIHRDVKPSNILITADGTAKLADFGIARALDMTRLTGSSTMLGTPHYMAPDHEVTPQSDLYSLGCVLYEMLAGHPPFEGDTQQQVMFAHLRNTVEVASLPREAGPFVAWMTRRDPSQRPRSATELAEALASGVARPVLGGGGSRSRRTAVAAVAAGCAALALVAVTTALMLGGGDDEPRAASPDASSTPRGTRTPTATRTVRAPSSGDGGVPEAKQTAEPSPTVPPITATAPSESTPPRPTATNTHTPSPTATRTPTRTPTATATPVPDADGDGVADAVDNCPFAQNPSQTDLDGDSLGDACDPTDNRDADGDGVQNYADVCPSDYGNRPNGCVNQPPNVPDRTSPPTWGTTPAGNTVRVCWAAKGDPDGDGLTYRVVSILYGDGGRVVQTLTNSTCADVDVGSGYRGGIDWHVAALDSYGGTSDGSFPCWTKAVDCHGDDWWIYFDVVD